MTLHEKAAYMDKRPIGVMGLCNYGGLEILDIIYSIDDYVVASFHWGDKRTNINRHKIEVASSGRMFFRKFGKRYYLDNIMKV